MKALIIYDLTGRIWNILYGEEAVPQGLPAMFADIPDGARLERVDVTDPENPKPVFSYLPESDIGRLWKRTAELEEGLTSIQLALAEQYGVEARFVKEPTERFLSGASLTAYPPVTEGDTNEEGLTILCAAGEFELLITGDMNSAAEKKLVEAYDLPDIEVLIAGHHGSKYSTSEELLETVWPEVGVLSVGENSFGHPAQEAMGRMAAAGMTLYRTDWQGNILIRVHPGTGGTNGG